MKRNYLPGPPIRVEGIVPIEKGGTGADNIEQAKINLGIVPGSSIGSPNGLIPLDEYGRFNSSYLEGLNFESVDIDGPTSLQIDEIASYKITNLDSRVNYVVRAIEGEVYINGDTITYKAPYTQVRGGGFIVNGSIFNVVIQGPDRSPNKPTIIEPSTDLEKNTTSVLFKSSNWSSAHSNDYLADVEWQISTESSFLPPAKANWVTTKQAMTLSLTGLEPGDEVFVRVRHKGYYGFNSPWSETRSYKRPLEQKPLKPTITSPSADTVGHNLTQIFTSSGFVGTSPNDAIETSEWEFSKNTTFSSPTQLYTKTSDFYNHQFNPEKYITYYVRVRYKGTSGWVSDWSDVRVFSYVPFEPPERPTIINPGINTIVTEGNPIITSTAFTPVSPGDQIQKAEWEFAKDSAFTVGVVRESKIGESYNSFVSPTLIPGEPTFYRVRYVGTSGWTSDWSLVRIVTFSEVRKPSILSPVTNTNRHKPDVIFFGSEFIVAGSSASHASSDWQLSETNTFETLVAFSTSNPSEKDSWLVSGLEYGKTYYARLRHRSDTGMVSAWSNVTEIRTRTSAWDPVVIAELVVNQPVTGVTITPTGDHFSFDNKLYRLDPIGPSLVREFNNDELFGNGKDFLTNLTTTGVAVSINETGGVVETFASAYMPDAVGAVPRSMLAYSKYVLSNGSLVRVEHIVTGNPFVTLANEPGITLDQPNNFQILAVQRANKFENFVLLLKQVGQPNIYYGEVSKLIKQKIVPVPSTDEYPIVEFPDSAPNALTVRINAVPPANIQRNFTSTGFFSIEESETEVRFYKMDNGLPKLIWSNPTQSLVNVLPQGQTLNNSEELLFSVQGNRLVILKN